MKLKALGTLGAHLILCVIGKNHKLLPSFHSMEECGVRFIENLKMLTGDDSLSLISPWVIADPSPASSAAVNAKSIKSGATTTFLDRLDIACNGFVGY